MCMQGFFPMSFSPGIPSVPPINPFMSCGTMLMPQTEEFQLQNLRFQMHQLQLLKENNEKSLEYLSKSIKEVEAAIQRIEGAKSKKGA